MMESDGSIITDMLIYITKSVDVLQNTTISWKEYNISIFDAAMTFIVFTKVLSIFFSVWTNVSSDELGDDG